MSLTLEFNKISRDCCKKNFIVHENSISADGGSAMPRSQNGKIKKLLVHLRELSLQFGQSAYNDKLSIVRELRHTKLLRASDLTAYHDILCFIRAFPDNARLLSWVEKELESYGRRIEQYKQLTSDKNGRRLLNTGIANTTIEHPFDYDVTRMLLRWYPDMLDIDWNQSGGDAEDNLYDILPLLISRQENDIIDNDDSFELLDWLNLAEGKRDRNKLKTVLRLITAADLPLEVQRHFFENLNIMISWELADSLASRTFKRVPSGKTYFHQKPLKTRTENLRAEIIKPPTALHLLSRREGAEWVRAVNEVLAVRNRELFALTFANPSEVYIDDPGRGLRIVIFGAEQDARLPLESNFGALLVRNGIPVGYGIAAALFDRVEIAINIFPAFRSGESSYTIEQFFRVFYHHFGSRVFVVRHEQMGYGEDEALHSGAFWFYFKLGFRAINDRVRRLAQKEYEKIRLRPRYRSPINVMKRLSKTDVYLRTDADDTKIWRELSLVNLGYVVTRYFAEKHNGDRRKGTIQSVSTVKKILKIHQLDQWSDNESTALQRMAPLIVNIPDLPDWSSSEKNALIKVIRSKGAARERRFVLLLNRHQRFRKALESLAGSYIANDET
jgi:hypothetical protein